MVAAQDMPDSASALATSCPKLALAVFKGEEDVAVAAGVHLMRHPPYVDCPGKAEHANMDGRGVRAPGVAAPVPAAAEDGQSAHIDVDTFRHVDIDVPERRQNRHRGPPPIDGSVAQIEVEIAENTGGDGPAAQPEPPAPRDMTKHGHGEPDGSAARAGGLSEDPRQVILQARQLPADRGPQGTIDSVRELLERQAAREKMLPKRHDGLFAIGVRGAQGGIIHSCHARSPMTDRATIQGPHPGTPKQSNSPRSGQSRTAAPTVMLALQCCTQILRFGTSAHAIADDGVWRPERRLSALGCLRACYVL
jgi:hypothetical protein